ncbi:MAG: hypothetical protein H6Q15_2038 [Bacteroidetes bacterium]|nr:hypothetical protein [Bacteroidota bacterium]
MFLFSLLSFGCTKRPLDLSKQDAKISVSFQWDKLPSWDTPSDSMKLYFYGEDGNIYIKEATSEGFSGTIPPQTYNILAVNTDSKGVEYKDLDNYNIAKVVLKSLSSLIPQSEKSLCPPERVYAVSLGNVTITNEQEQHLFLTPEEYSKKATIRLFLSGDVNSIQTCQTEISGLSNGIRLHNKELIKYEEYPNKLIIDNVNTSELELSTSFFGVAPDYSESKLALNLIFSDGYKKTLYVDASDAFKNVVLAVKVSIYIDVFKETEGSFNAKIKSWIVTNENIILK